MIKYVFKDDEIFNITKITKHQINTNKNEIETEK